MNKGVAFFQKNEGKGRGYRRYVNNLYMLVINVKDDGRFANFQLMSQDSDTISGDTTRAMYNALDSLFDKYGLQTKTEYSKDIVLVYVADVRLVEAFFSQKHIQYYKYDNKDLNFAEYKDNIQIRCWRGLMPESDLPYDEIFNVLMIWQKKFIENKRTFLTLAQYPRKSMLVCGQSSNIVPDTITKLGVMYHAVHAGVLYTDYKEKINTPMIGVDLISAYIHAIIYRKHCVSMPVRNNADLWEQYLHNDNIGFVGMFELHYICNHVALHCYTTYPNDKPLDTGEHTVKIVLSDIDLDNLIKFKDFRIISVHCCTIYTFKLDYLPDNIRQYCIGQFTLKQTLPKDTLDYKLQKTILNAGFFGNFLFESNRILQHYYAGERVNYKRFIKDASASPIWGIYTCAYVRRDIITTAQQLNGWHYSDTDSIYCDDNAHNRDVINRFNEDRWISNMESIDDLKYTTEQLKYIGTLGQFKPEEQISRFRFFSFKRYAYQTIGGKVVIKASGTPKAIMKKYDDSIFDLSNIMELNLPVTDYIVERNKYIPPHKIFTFI